MPNNLCMAELTLTDNSSGAESVKATVLLMAVEIDAAEKNYPPTTPRGRNNRIVLEVMVSESMLEEMASSVQAPLEKNQDKLRHLSDKIKVDMITKNEFSDRNLTSNAGLFLLLDHANKNGIFNLIDHDLVFKTASTDKIKMNHIKTLLCGNLIEIDKLERLKLL